MTTYGPQHEYVVALVDRARGLTPEEVDGLASARAAVGAVDWDACASAWSACASACAADRDAACDAACIAAWDAARDAAWDVAWDAAWYATLALVVRDLIGDTFTQTHYDTLRAPWCSVKGPIHPDDEEL